MVTRDSWVDSKEFATDSRKPFSSSLLQALNTNCVSLAARLLGHEYDALGGDWVKRETPAHWAQAHDAPRRAGPGIGLAQRFPYREPYLAPTLFETDVCRIPDRSFVAAILPYRNATIVIIYYPTSTVFDKDGVIVETKLWLSEACQLIDAIRHILAMPGHTDQNPDLTEQHVYWETVGKVRTRVEKLPMFSKMKIVEPNLPLLPFEYALRQVERGPG